MEIRSFGSVLATATLLAASVGAQVAWRPQPVTGPSPREGHLAATDPARGVTVLFGGRDGTGAALADTWTWDGSSWAVLGTVGATPSARRNHGLAYDAARARIVLFGGVDGSGSLLDDTWEWDGQSWVFATAAIGPSARQAHAMASSPNSAGVLMFGGAGRNGAMLGDTWVLDGSGWRSISTPVPPPARFGHRMDLDGRRDRVVLFGGQGANDDLWEWDGVVWSRLSSVATPGPRTRHALAYDAVRERIVLVGGATGSTFAARDTWDWDGVAWHERTGPGEPPARLNAAFAFDPSTGRCVLFGGLDAFGLLSDTNTFGTDAVATATLFGSGCAGAIGVPELRCAAGDRPWLGDAMTIELVSLASGALPVLGGGFSTSTSGALSLPFPLDSIGMPGCTLLVDQIATAVLVNSAGQATLPIVLPDIAQLMSLRVHFQAEVYEPGANALGVVTSNGLTLTLGAR